MEYVWIVAAIFAAGCQTARSAFQKNMISKLGDYGAAYIRFCYALPFTSLVWFVWINTVSYTHLTLPTNREV